MSRSSPVPRRDAGRVSGIVVRESMNKNGPDLLCVWLNSGRMNLGFCTYRSEGFVVLAGSHCPS